MIMGEMEQNSSPKASEGGMPNKAKAIWVQIVAFYNRHFPTDKKSFNVRIPLLGLVLSLFSLHFFIVAVVKGTYYNSGYIAFIAYILLAAGGAFELYWGLKIGDRKQYTPWILLKGFELLLTSFAIIYFICDNHRHFKHVWGTFLYSLPILFCNAWIGWVILHRIIRPRPSNNRDQPSGEETFPPEAPTYDNV